MFVKDAKIYKLKKFTYRKLVYQQVHQKSDLITKENIGAVFYAVAAGEAVNIYCTAQ